MNDFYNKHGIKTDPIYSGKSLYALYDMITKDQFKEGSTIVYYHCGGLQGIEGMEKRYGISLF
jgi:1-aminocyclopropane-1-carboxylate deaminase